MPRLINRPPAYCRHKPTNRAYVKLNGERRYLGEYKSPESKQAYNRLVGEWLANGKRLPEDAEGMTIVELAAAFVEHADAYYRKRDADGQPTDEHSTEFATFKSALKPLVEVYGYTCAADFGPLALRAVMDRMVALGWCRKYVNGQAQRLKGVFKWATASELVPGSVYEALRAVKGLARGRTEAPESKKVRPVAEAHARAVQPFVSRQVWAMIELQLLTGMRPGEAVQMRACDLEMGGKVWIYTPATHKTQHHDIERKIAIGPRAQEVLRPYLTTNTQAFLFRPIDAEQERRDEVHAQRVTPMSCGNVPGSNKKRKPRRQPGEHYTVDSYRRAITRGCELAYPWPKLAGRATDELTKDDRMDMRRWNEKHHWHPHQLRHTAGTNIRKKFGLEATQVVLGHAKADVTQIYAEADADAAAAVMAQVG